MRNVEQSFLRQPLTWILGTAANVSILRELFKHGGEVTLPSLVARTDLAQSTVRESVMTLVRTSVVEEIGGQRSRLYRIRAKHPVVKRLRALFEAESHLFTAMVYRLYEAVGDVNEARAVWMYGSVARKIDRPGSDIDILVVADRPTRLAAADAVRAALQPEEPIFNAAFSVVTLDFDDVTRLVAGNDPWWQTASRDALVLKGLTPQEVIAAAEKAESR